jgi:hypothetical protein
MGKNEKPPSLAGVEKFIRAKIAAAAAAAGTTASVGAGVPPPNTSSPIAPRSLGAAPPAFAPPASGAPGPPAGTDAAAAASKTNAAPLNGEPTATTEEDPVNPPPVPSMQANKETNQTTTDAPQLFPVEPAIATASGN